MNKIHLNNMKLRDRLLLMYILSVFLPLVMTNVVFYHVTTTNITNQKVRDATHALESIKGSVKAIVDQAAGLSYSFYADRTFNDYLSQQYASSYEYVDAYDSYLKHAFSDSDKHLLGPAQYKVYTDNPTILTGYIEPLTDEVKQSGWYIQFNSFFVPHATLISSDRSFSLIQRLDNYYSNGFNQILKIDLDISAILHYFYNSSFDGNVYLVDPSGKVQFTNDAGIDRTMSAVHFRDLPIPSGAEHFTTAYAGTNYLDGWTLHGVVDREVVFQEVQKSRSFILVLASINFAVPSIILAAMSKSLHVRLQRILKHMKKVKNQHFQLIPHEEGRDEIAQLTNEFNRMTEQISSLIHDVYRVEIQKKNLELKQQQAQLHALHSQINPHFLFNALESIRMRSVIKEEEETADIIHNMAVMFRKSISWSREWIELREEVAVIRSFLEIQKYRFDEEFDYDIQVDEEALNWKVPMMIFLPFVENASIHGIESVPQIGIIRVRISVQADKLKFTLEDNGTGMSPKKLDEIRRYLTQDDVMGERVGMKNTYHRLKLIYQDRFTFHIHSKEDKGTRIEIRLPAHVEELGEDTECRKEERET